ncbi:hypothetical protein M5X00_25825 [Paenibacillus alvei]|uniref:hypothetical protein n=1 Tax=Paenibacillus alvei TaxID=44250 RepID=UPI00228014F8|nr:hypothetical protein [Paenibacillus alvei]MCY9757649.1 hypothetical protein [Paenibacillus alvei]
MGEHIEQGSIVAVVDTGETYTQFTELFNHAVSKSGVEGITHAYNKVPEKHEAFIVLAVVRHFDSNAPIALIQNDNQKAYLIGTAGLKLN